MRVRQAIFGLALTLPGMLGGCGWTPLYADQATGPADAELRAIKVDAIPERIGQQLAIALRDTLNPSGIPTPTRYELKTTLAVSRADLGVQSQGLATRGQVDVIATYVLRDIAARTVLLTNTVHVANSFDILANGYATVVTEDDAHVRTVEELRNEIFARLTMFMQRRAETAAAQMKIAAARVDAVLRRPDPELHAVLFYGPDAGLVRERADTIARAICPELHDAFRVAELSGAGIAADPARLGDEAAQISLMGGRRVVRVRDAGDAAAQLFARFLAAPAGDTLVVVEAGDLPGRSSLRRAFDESAHGAAIGCYPDTARDLAAVIRDSLAAHRVGASRDATDFLVEHLGNDRLVTRSELEKLTLYAGDGGRIELDDARVVIADAAALALDDAVLAAAEGDAAALDRALARVFQEGESPVSVIRATLRHIQRLHALAGRIAGGSSVDEAIRSARPPVFFKQQDSFRRQLTRWRESRLRRHLDKLADAEAQMKTTGLPAETICRAALLDLARSARV